MPDRQGFVIENRTNGNIPGFARRTIRFAIHDSQTGALIDNSLLSGNGIRFPEDVMALPQEKFDELILLVVNFLADWYQTQVAP
jgi:hypothetical protein